MKKFDIWFSIGVLIEAESEEKIDFYAARDKALANFMELHPEEAVEEVSEYNDGLNIENEEI